MDWFETLNPVIQALLATTFTWGVTALGALVVCFFKEVNSKILNTILGFSAGVMIAAAFWSLLEPSIDLSQELGYIAWALPAIGFITGGLFVLISDKFLDKMLKNRKSIGGKGSLKRSILLIAAITIHNIPEGMAVGVAFGGIASGVPGMTLIGAVMLALGIGIQNFPEGAAVSLPLRTEGYSDFSSMINYHLTKCLKIYLNQCGSSVITNITTPFNVYKKYVTIFTCFCSRSNDNSSCKRAFTRINNW